jgi:hypothetical protein
MLLANTEACTLVNTLLSHHFDLCWLYFIVFDLLNVYIPDNINLDTKVENRLASNE